MESSGRRPNPEIVPQITQAAGGLISHDTRSRYEVRFALRLTKLSIPRFRKLKSGMSEESEQANHRQIN